MLMCLWAYVDSLGPGYAQSDLDLRCPRTLSLGSRYIVMKRLKLSHLTTECDLSIYECIVVETTFQKIVFFKTIHVYA